MEFIPDIDRLTEIFSNAIAPSFFLGAVAAFVSLMTTRLAAINERIRATITRDEGNPAAVHSSAVLAGLTRRARLLSNGIVLSLGSGIGATLLLAILFASQFFGLTRAYGAALVFIAATMLLGAALFRFGQEALLAGRELEELHSRIGEHEPWSRPMLVQTETSPASPPSPRKMRT